MFHFSPRNALLPSAALAILLGLTACGGGGGSDAEPVAATPTPTPTPDQTPTPTPTPTPESSPPAAPAPTVAFGLTQSIAGVARIVGFNLATPNTLTTDVAITSPATPFAAGEFIFGMDFRPADGVLWGLSNRGRLFTIDPTTGVATFQVVLTADPADTSAPFTALDSSTSITVDFNPVVDRLRVVSYIGQNLRVNVGTGFTTTDTDLPIAGASGFSGVAAAAYTNSVKPTPTTTTLFTVNNINDNLATQAPPNDGTQVPVGPLNAAITDVQGMDIAGGTIQLALGAFRLAASGPHSLYDINLTSGAAVLRPTTTGTAEIGGPAGLPLVDIAIRP